MKEKQRKMDASWARNDKVIWMLEVLHALQHISWEQDHVCTQKGKGEDGKIISI